MRFILRGFAALLLPASAALAPAAAQGPASGTPPALTRVGVAAAVRGSVRAAPQGEVGRVVESGRPLFLGEHVTTGDDGILQVMLLDETVFSIGPNSDLSIDRFAYAPGSDDAALLAHVARGVFKFVSGRVSREHPGRMRVTFPVGSMAVRGTIAAGVIEQHRSTVLLMGPGRENNADELAGSIALENAGSRVVISVPGLGASVEDGQAPGPPMAMPDLVRQVSDSLSRAPDKSLPQALKGQGASAEIESGQDSAAGREKLAEQLLEARVLAKAILVDRHASWDYGPLDGPATWEDLRFFAVGGQGTYSASGAFTQSLCASVACSVAGTWGFTATIHYGSRNVSIFQFINAGSIVESGGGPANYSNMTGAAAFPVPSPSGQYQYTLINGAGIPAVQLQGTVTYNDVGAGDAGSGVPLTAIAR